jgi:hypothetical protein
VHPVLKRAWVLETEPQPNAWTGTTRIRLMSDSRSQRPLQIQFSANVQVSEANHGFVALQADNNDLIYHRGTVLRTQPVPAGMADMTHAWKIHETSEPGTVVIFSPLFGGSVVGYSEVRNEVMVVGSEDPRATRWRMELINGASLNLNGSVIQQTTPPKRGVNGSTGPVIRPENAKTGMTISIIVAGISGGAAVLAVVFVVFKVFYRKAKLRRLEKKAMKNSNANLVALAAVPSAPPLPV